MTIDPTRRDESENGKKSQASKKRPGSRTRRRLTINPLTKLPHPPNLPDNPRLRENIIILYPVQQFTETPERIGLYRFEYFLW